MKNGDDRPEGPVPALRFPGFRDAPPWEVKRLGDLCRPKQWKTISEKDLLPEGYPVFGANGFIGFYSTFNHLEDTVVIGCRGSCGEVSVVPGPSYITGNAMCLDDVQEEIVLKPFLAEIIGFTGTQRIISGSAQPQIVRGPLLNFKIPLPSLPEQGEIADCLQTWDEAIEKTGDEIKALTRQKRGLMQKLFPAPGEVTPALRFPEFQDSPPWQVKRLGKVADIKRGASPRPISSPIWFDDESDIGWVRISDVTASGRVLLKTTQKLSQEGVKKSRIVPPGHIIMSICGTIGKPICTGF
ncbi:MAG: restriction endonuclease subunit S, partial [Hyphomonadaceae bacterium]|nr:restriction endonuclease subunit S [Hyphomonadaceae bacterium]